MSFIDLGSFIFPVHTDTVEFSPCKRKLLCGSYELNEETRHISGHLAFFNIQGEFVDLKECLTLTQGILDLSWVNSELCLGAGSSGKLYSILVSDEQPVKVSTVTGLAADSLLLSVDVQHSKVVASAASGRLFVYDLDEAVVMSEWKGHDFEPWCIGINRNDENLLLSGGDDCFLRVWDQRQGFQSAVFSKRHEMGVCSVSHVPGDTNLISTGCFDEQLRIWDLRQGVTKESVLCHTEGGGVWRHKWSASRDGDAKTRILLAAMHAGFAVVSSPTDFSSSTALAYYRQSCKLAYGVDWIMVGGDKRTHFKALIAACSFYDNHVTFSIYED